MHSMKRVSSGYLVRGGDGGAGGCTTTSSKGPPGAATAADASSNNSASAASSLGGIRGAAGRFTSQEVRSKDTNE